MSRDFYELCYDQYKQEMNEADGLYQKAGVMLVVLPLLGTLSATLGRIDILNQLFVRVDVFFYYFAFLIAIIVLAASVVFLFLCVYPRKYKTLANMDAWQKWREDYQKYLSKGNEGPENQNTDALDTALFMNLCPRLVEAQPINAEINEKRRKYFKRSVQIAMIALTSIAVQSLFHLILKAQGI